MPSTSGKGEARLERAQNQILNAERLIAQLPKRFYSNDKQREKLDNLRKTLLRIKQELADLI